MLSFFGNPESNNICPAGTAITGARIRSVDPAMPSSFSAACPVPACIHRTLFLLRIPQSVAARQAPGPAPNESVCITAALSSTLVIARKATDCMIADKKYGARSSHNTKGEIA